MLALASAGPWAADAAATTNASSAASFIENAQNADGGFSETHGAASDPQASLWATVALLAAGKNPTDEQLNNGASADDYLAAHLAAYRSLTDLGLLAIVQAASGASPSRYGDPGTELRADLTVPAIRADPGGAALGAIGLLALRDNAAAAATARTLETTPLSDGGWGERNESDSASTALVLEALAQSGVATSADPVVAAGLAYLHRAQVNDGSIAISDRTDASSSGDVASTAFTIQALEALHHAQLRTPTGTSVLAGLADYQQVSSGGLSPFGAYDTGVAPSVTQTAQAYPAFDGVAFPLPYVAPQPPPAKPAPAPANTSAVNRTSVGTATQGISSGAATPAQRHPVAAFQGASAAGSAKAHRRSGQNPAGPSVSGTVVGATATPKLVTRVGRPPATDHTALYLALILVALAAVGAALERRRPRQGMRSPVATGVQAADSLRLAALRRGAFAPALVILLGAAAIAIPITTGMWHRAPKGAVMVAAFAPYMHAPGYDRLAGDIGVLNAGFDQARGHGGAQLAQFERQWPGIDRRFDRLLTTISATRGDYDAVASLPSLSAFPWFLLAPGVLLLALGAIALVWPRSWRRARFAVLAIGVALVAAPLALGLFSAGQSGARMLTAFETVETTGNVTALQDDFGQIALGESALTIEIPPRSLARIPAAEQIERRWVPILGELTPTLGVMSDNVANYDAVRALPAFTTFPWLFVGPGALAILIVLLSTGALLRPIRLRARRAHPNLEARSSP